jgi:glycosyltransferase involved in cell wall biosynthesis
MKLKSAFVSEMLDKHVFNDESSLASIPTISFGCTAVVLPVSNEESRLREVLEYYKILGDRIYIVDNCSTDSTVAIASEYNTYIVSHRNDGSTENPSWFRWLLSTIKAEKYLFLSCSERFTYSALRFLAEIEPQSVDLCYMPRVSYTGGQKSLIYGSIVSIVGLSSETLNVCRFISRNALLESCDKIIIHDNFRSFRYRHNCVTCNQKNIYIKHMRPLTSYDTLAKLLAYARIEAGSRSCGFQSFLILFSKIIREFLVAVILFFSFRLSRIRLRELLARVIYHLSVFLILDSSAE